MLFIVFRWQYVSVGYTAPQQKKTCFKLWTFSLSIRKKFLFIFPCVFVENGYLFCYFLKSFVHKNMKKFTLICYIVLITQFVWNLWAFLQFIYIILMRNKLWKRFTINLLNRNSITQLVMKQKKLANLTIKVS